MHERWSLRLRIFLFFLLIILASAGVIGTLLWIAANRIGPGSGAPLVLFGGASIFAIALICMGVWRLFDDNVARAIEQLAADLETQAQPRVLGGGIDVAPARYLGGLGVSAERISNALQAARAANEKNVNAAVAASKAQIAQLETILHDLPMGIVICNRDYRILLYNRKAAQLLHVAGEVGLGRSLFTLVSEHAIRHAVERLRASPAQDAARGIDSVCATRREACLLHVTVALARHQRPPSGVETGEPVERVVLTFADATRAIHDNTARHRLVSQTIETLRQSAMAIQGVTEIMNDAPLYRDYGKRCEEILRQESERLNTAISHLADRHQALRAGGWPMSDVYSSALFSCVAARLDTPCTIEGAPLRLHCDGGLIVEMLVDLARLRAGSPLTLCAEDTGLYVCLDMRWQGDPLAWRDIEAWLAKPLAGDPARATADEILERHHGELWPLYQEAPYGVRLALYPAVAADAPAPVIRARPEFYDFALGDHDDEQFDAQARLQSLSYVVFDTETTGLDPSGGDEIVSIAGVRIVNGRLLRGEIFDTLVNPGRAIPVAATRIHRIDDSMVADAPFIETVLPRFHDFARDAVLVAHNAAFDMKFLRLKEAGCAIVFANPVLDTVLLSAGLYGQGADHTLDALMARFAVELPAEERHTALGDSIATAQVLLHLLEVLAGRGVRRLGEALAISDRMRGIRRRQARY